MAITVNTNMSSLIAQRSLNSASSKMDTAMERMSTGLKINSAKDDAAGCAVATKLEYKISSLAIAQDNAQMGTSMLQTTEGTLDVMQSNLQRIRDLSEQAANGTYGTDAMVAIKSEVNARLNEVTRMSETSEFNGKKLLNGSCGDVNLQVGIESNAESIIKLDKSLFSSAAATKLLDTSTTGTYNPSISAEIYSNTVGADTTFYAKINDDFIELDGVAAAECHFMFQDGTATGTTTPADQNFSNVRKADAAMKATLKNAGPNATESPKTITIEDGISLKPTAANPENEVIDDMLSWVYATDSFSQGFLNNVDSAIANVTNRKTELGATMQRVTSAMEVGKTMETNLTDAVSLIKDADIAKESSNYIKNQILQQSASTLLATANQTPQIALQLI